MKKTVIALISVISALSLLLFPFQDPAIFAERTEEKTVIFPQIQGQAAVLQRDAAEKDPASHIFETGIREKGLILFFIQLMKCGIAVSVQAGRLIHAHRLKNTDGLPHGGGGGGGQNHGDENQDGRNLLGL